MCCQKKLLTVIFSLLFLSSCKEKPLLPNEMKDAAGNIYKTVVIGNQVWMAENLRAVFVNVPNGNDSFFETPVEADFWYPDFNPETMSSYGLLYTFDAAKTLLPKGGWRIPALHDIDILLNELGVNFNNGGIAMAAGLNINSFPGSNEDDNSKTIDKFFWLLLDELSTNSEFEYRSVRMQSRDFPDDNPPLYRINIDIDNVSWNFASSVRFVKDVD